MNNKDAKSYTPGEVVKTPYGLGTVKSVSGSRYVVIDHEPEIDKKVFIPSHGEVEHMNPKVEKIVRERLHGDAEPCHICGLPHYACGCGWNQ